jgi:hypothetical protein
MKTQSVSAAEQKVRDAEETLRNIDRRVLNAQVALAIFPLFLGAMIALYSLGDSTLFAVSVGFGSILMAAIGIWIVENSDLARERQRAWDAREALRSKYRGSLYKGGDVCPNQQTGD